MKHSGETTFASWRSYWDFERSVRRELRYIHSEETQDFLDAVLASSRGREVDLPAGRTFWRAQLGNDWRRTGDEPTDEEVPCAHPRARMTPLPDRASDGRANPRGIPCLYLATSKETAMSEVRPWIGSYVSVGQFRTTRPLAIVNCTAERPTTPLHLEEPDASGRSEAVWAHIDRAFAEPTTRSDDAADYVPTQIIAELFKRAGLDGIAYRSNFGGGFNLALFDLAGAELVNCGLFEVDAMQPSFKEADQFYFISDMSRG
ncbi:RES domain-containing protein [Sphingomonas palmae]|uniref:RES domain-containing protein n=1 Tax=Sphingomonas palmae TaxID=1855283 RepID=A0A1H7T7I8_9SPHN|nr:RES family NAD+ phosphorylase [Sphingomonas palmae]SEL80314.1 RES domain-containing protein [Sphingomonas palmae]